VCSFLCRELESSNLCVKHSIQSPHDVLCCRIFCCVTPLCYSLPLLPMAFVGDLIQWNFALLLCVTLLGLAWLGAGRGDPVSEQHGDSPEAGGEGQACHQEL
jgi:hypothetical protein